MSPSHSPYSRVKRDYEDVYGEKKGMNPYLGADNTMKPVGFKNDGKSPTKFTKGRVKFADSTAVNQGVANGNAAEVTSDNEANGNIDSGTIASGDTDTITNGDTGTSTIATNGIVVSAANGTTTHGGKMD